LLGAGQVREIECRDHAGIAETIGEPSVDTLMAKHVCALDEARDRVPPDRATLAARRGRALPESEVAARVQPGL
jgi:hypothetical protein